MLLAEILSDIAAVGLAGTQTITGIKTFYSGQKINNPANTFAYVITAGAISAERILNLPVITGTDTLATLGLAQTFSAIKTFSANPVLSADSAILSFSSATGAKQITTGGTTDLALMPGGRIGIGTNTPASKLDVNGNISWGIDSTEETTPNNRSAYVLQHHTGLSLSAHSYYGGVRIYNQVSSTPHGYNGTMVMAITGGKVGILNSTPLDVRTSINGNVSAQVKNESTGTSAVQRFLLENNATYQGDFRLYGSNVTGTLGGINRANLLAIMAQNTTAGLMIYTGTKPLYLANANGVALYVKSDLKIGINTINPVTLLHVNGKGSFGDSVTSSNSIRILNLCSTDAVMRVLRISANIDTAAPGVELLHRTTADGTDTDFWDFFINSTGFNIRDRRPIVIGGPAIM